MNELRVWKIIWSETSSGCCLPVGQLVIRIESASKSVLADCRNWTCSRTVHERSSLSQTHSGVPLLQGIPPEPQVICGILPLFETIRIRKISKRMVKGCGFPFKDSRAASSPLRNVNCGLCVFCIAERTHSLFRGNFTASNQPHQGHWRASLLSLQLELVVTILGLYLLGGKPH